MGMYFTTVVSNIRRAKDDAAYILVGRVHVARIKSVRFVRRPMFASRLEVTLTTGGAYVVQQCDRGAYFVDGPHIHGDGIRVDGWADAVKLLNNM